jgi:hypothetical protein
MNVAVDGRAKEAIIVSEQRVHKQCKACVCVCVCACVCPSAQTNHKKGGAVPIKKKK